jgi:asparagine synthase (glutamine-hydrolysing)
MTDSVRLRLRSDVTVGTSLSGGVDSSIVAASIRAADPSRDLAAFTASFPGDPLDEFERAALTASRHGFQHHRVEPEVADFVADLPLLVRRQNGPIESPTVYAQWCVMRRALEEGTTVLLDGQGADETWGGYLKHPAASILAAALRGRVVSAASTLRAWSGPGDRPAFEVAQLGALLLPAALRVPALRALVARRRSMLGPALRHAAFDPPVPAVSGDVVRRLASADLQRMILPRLLRYADRNSMAWSREVRLPYLDLRVAEAGLRSGWSAGHARGWTKYALRRAFEPVLPREVLWRRTKTAYQVPEERWISHPPVQRLLADARRDLVDRGVLAARAAANPWRTLSLALFVDEYGLR